VVAVLAGSRLMLARVVEGTWVGNLIDRFMHGAYFHVGNLPVTPAFLLKAAVYLIVLGFIAGFTRNILQNRILARTSLEPGQRYAFSRVTSYVVYLAGLAIGVQSAGVNLSSLLVVGGAVGIGVGLGLQNIANNFVAGFVLLLEQPVRLGDRVEVGGVLGDVVRLAGRSTWVRTNDNVVIIVPNADFISNRVTNWTANDRRVRFRVPLGVSYGSDPEKVRQILLEIAANHPDILRDPAPDVVFLGFGDSALNFELRVWSIRQVQTPKILESDLYFTIFRVFSEKGIEIPFPQRDLHLKSVELPIPILNAH
jgi:small-conductance mechanosensitive channel